MASWITHIRSKNGMPTPFKITAPVTSRIVAELGLPRRASADEPAVETLPRIAGELRPDRRTLPRELTSVVQPSSSGRA